MKKTTLYRADDYYKNSGDIVGFFSTKEDAESEIEFSKPTTQREGTFSQITEFTIHSSAIKDVDVSDTERMIEEDIWGEGDIVNDYYYE